MTDKYNLDLIMRYRRSRDYPENKSISKEIQWIDNKVKLMETLSRAYFKHENNKQVNRYNKIPEIAVTLELMLELTNSAYENTLEFTKKYKNKPIVGFINYLLKDIKILK